jgi:prolyl 4-hydroxylase
LPEQAKIYDDYMEGCYNRYGTQYCDDYENDRIKMNLEQPHSMVHYTSTGFKKIKAPTELFSLLKAHFDRNHEKMKEGKEHSRANSPHKRWMRVTIFLICFQTSRLITEKWSKGNVYVNHWASPTYMISVEDTDMEGGGLALKYQVWDAAKPIVETWT